MTGEYRICSRCIMDTSDPEIQFDEQGVCNHCHEYDRQVAQNSLPGESGRNYVERLAERIKRDGKGKKYDCIIGVSGGVDSTYVAYKVKQLGLRPLAVHLDNGWDSELAVKNIEEVLKRLNIDLYTNVLGWEEFKDLQVAFLKASTPDSEIPSDHAIWATLGNLARKIGVRYIVTGFNVHTETHLPRSWSQGHLDWTYIRNVQKCFGKVRLKTFPHENLFTYYYRLLTLRRIPLLNFLNFNKQDSMKVLEQELGWRYYGGKHYESIYTRFYQGYILPEKFGFDKRRSHLSSMICSGGITRPAALEELAKPTYSPSMQEDDREYVVKKLGLSDDEFEAILRLPKNTYWDYSPFGRMLEQGLMKRIYGYVRRIYRARRRPSAESV